MNTEKSKIPWRSLEERMACFNALVTLAERGCIMPIEAYQRTMDLIVGRPTFTHELGTTGLEELRKEIQGLPHLNTFEIIDKIRSSAKGH